VVDSRCYVHFGIVRPEEPLGEKFLSVSETIRSISNCKQEKRYGKAIGKYLRAWRPISAPLTIAIIFPEYICVYVCVLLKSLYSKAHSSFTFSKHKLVPAQIKVCITYGRVSNFSRDRRWIIYQQKHLCAGESKLRNWQARLQFCIILHCAML
jgi:hypothetical protein